MPLAYLEQLLRAGAYLRVRRTADRLLLEGGLSMREQAAVLRMACRASLALKDYYAAAKLGEMAIARAEEAGDPDTQARSHFYVGCTYTYIGDTYTAEEHLQRFFSLFHSMPELERWEGTAHYNLSILQRQRRQWGQAIEALQQATRLFERHGQQAERAQAALDLAWCFLMLQLAPLALPHLEYLEAYLVDHQSESLAADLLCARALYERLGGDIEASSHLCQEVFVPDRPGVTSHHLGEAAWIMGENALDLGRLEEARLFVNMALDHAARDNWPGLMNLAGDLRRRLVSQLETES